MGACFQHSIVDAKRDETLTTIDDGQLGPASSPVSGSILTVTISDGFGKLVPPRLGRRSTADLMKSINAGSAASAPVSPNCLLSSNTIKTAQTRFGVKPTNQPSREVPVLPATAIFLKMPLARRAVPRLITS